MKLLHERPLRDNDEHLIPLINVVLLLLIFFMLVGRVTPPDELGVAPPVSESRLVARPTALLILVDVQGRLVVDGVSVRPERLAAEVAERLAERPRAVQVKADAELEAARLVEILERLRAGGVESLDLLTTVRDA